MKLPPELWVRICQFACEVDGEVLLEDNEDTENYEEKTRQPAITRVCRVIRQETLSHFYRTNIFHMVDDGLPAWGLMSWAKAIGNTNFANLQKLYVTSENDEIKGHLRIEAAKADGLQIVFQNPEIIRAENADAKACLKFRLTITG